MENENVIPEVKTFTQEELDRIVGERLAREKSKYADYEDLKAIDEELKAFGYEGTPKERREAIKAQRESIAKQAELEELKQQAEISGTSPELLAEIREAKKEAQEAKKRLAEIEQEKAEKLKEIEAKKQADEAWNKQVKEFTDAYGDVDLDELAENAKFKKFVKGKNLPLKELYEDFVEFIGEAESEAIIKAKSKEIRSTSGGKGANSNGNEHLSEEQKKTLAEWNKKNPRMQMTAKEFLSRY